MCKIKTTEEALQLSKEQLEDEINNYSEYLSMLREVKNKKRLNEFEWGGKYIKIYGCNADGPEYMHCDSCSLDTSHYHSEPCIWFKGVGFSSSFGPYEDSNYINFSTWDDYYLNYRFWEEKENGRNLGNIKENDYDWNSYRVVIITKEEYEQAFNDMITQLKDTFNEWK